ncbi:UNVERIFIED_CONTAM: hypothetical protein FKN15_078200 [Acipenser sinensis]
MHSNLLYCSSISSVSNNTLTSIDSTENLAFASCGQIDTSLIFKNDLVNGSSYASQGLMQVNVRKLEMLQQIASRVQRDCVAGEDKLVLAKNALQSDAKRLESGIQFQNEAEIVGYLLECESLLRQQVVDIQILLDGKYYLADQLVQSFTSSLTPCLTPSLTPAMTPGLQPAMVQGYVTGMDSTALQSLKLMQIRKPLVKSSIADPNLTEEEVNMNFVQDLLNWVEEMQIQMTSPHKYNYSERLSKLENQYGKLLNSSRNRQKYLESLHEFVSRATQEIIWLNEKEEEEVAYDWSDRNSNMAKKRDYHADLMRELDEKERAIKSVQDMAERLLLENHPARLTIEAYRAAMQTQWSWILQLCGCVEQHLKENAVYFESWIEFGRIKLPQEYHPNDVEREWGKLIIAMLEREKSLRPEVDRLEMLQQIASRVQRDCVAGEDKLVLAKNALQSDAKRLESGIQFQNEAEIVGYLLECESLLRQQVVDIQILLDGKYYLADQLVQSMLSLNCIILFYDFTMVQLDRSEWGSDLPTVETHLENHKSVHRAIEDFQMSLKEAKFSEIQMTSPHKYNYSERLSKLENQYGKLLNSSRNRQKYLESLHEFVSRATQEIIWLNEKEEEEVAYDWSDRNSNMAKKRDYHADLMRELDEKERAIKSVQDMAERLLLENHPARLTIEAYRAAMQTQWSWILQLCGCVEQHLKENAVYFEFFNDAKESMDYLNNLQDTIQRKYDCDRTSNLHKLEDLIKESMDEKEQLLQYRSTVASLVGRAKGIAQLKPRNPDGTIRCSIPVKAICDYRQIEITIFKEDECVLASNSYRAKWKVISPNGNEAMVPSVCFTIPPPNKEAIETVSRIEQLYQNVLTLWHRSHINMKSVVSWHYLMNDIEAIQNSNVASIKTMLPGEHQQVLSNLQSHLENFLEDSQESEVFTVFDRGQLEREVVNCKQHYEDLLKSAEREEHEESVYNMFISEVRNFRMRLENYEERLIRQIRAPLERDDLQESVLRIAEQEKSKKELDRLKEDLETMQEKCETFISQAASTPSVPTLSTELNVVVQNMNQVYSMSSIYLEKLKTVSRVVKNSQGAEALVRLYEAKLCEEDAVNAETKAIETVLYQNVLTLWHRSHINMKSVVSWHYLMNDIEAIQNSNVASIKTMLPGEHQQVLSNLQSHFEDFLQDSQESEVFTVSDRGQLEREVVICKQYYEDLLKSAEREEHEESVYNLFISEVRNFRMRLENYEERLIRQIRAPLERDDLQESVLRIAEQEKSKKELDRLKEDLETMQEKCETFISQAASTPSVPTLSTELNVVVQNMNQVYSMSSIYLEKLKTVSRVVKNSQGAEALVRLYEAKLCEEDAVNAETKAIETVVSTLKLWCTEIGEKREVFHDLEDELQKARAISDRMFKMHNERDFDLDWHKEKADQLAERWQNVHSQIENRLRDLECTYKSLKYYKDTYHALDEWIKEMEDTQLKMQENQPEDSKALAELLNQQKVLVSEIEMKHSKIDECQKYSEQYSAVVKDYELQLMTYRAMVDSQQKSPVKRRRMQSSSDVIIQEFMDLRTRYTALVTLMTQYVKFASETLKRTEEEEYSSDEGELYPPMETEYASNEPVNIGRSVKNAVPTALPIETAGTNKRDLPILTNTHEDGSFPATEKKENERDSSPFEAVMQDTSSVPECSSYIFPMDTIKGTIDVVDSAVSPESTVVPKKKSVEEEKKEHGEKVSKLLNWASNMKKPNIKEEKLLQDEKNVTKDTSYKPQVSMEEVATKKEQIAEALRTTQLMLVKHSDKMTEEERQVTKQELKSLEQAYNDLSQQSVDQLPQPQSRLDEQDYQTIEGLIDLETGAVFSVCRAMQKGLIDYTTGINLLEAQLITSGLILPELSVSMEEVATKKEQIAEALRTTQLMLVKHSDKMTEEERQVTKQELKSLEQAYNDLSQQSVDQLPQPQSRLDEQAYQTIEGLIDLETGAVFSVCRAMQKGLIDYTTGINLLEAQLITSGLILPELSVCLDVDDAFKHGLVDKHTYNHLQEMNGAKRCILSAKYASEPLPLIAALRDGIISEQLAIRMIEMQLATGGLRVTYTGDILNLEKAFQSGLIPPPLFLKILEREDTCKDLIDPNTAERVSLIELVQRSLVHEETGLRLLPVKKGEDGKIALKSGREVSILRAVHEGLIDRETMFRLLGAQLFAGGIMDPTTNCKLNVMEAVQEGLIDQDTACKILSYQAQNGGIVNPCSGDRLTVDEAVQCNLITSSSALLVLEKQKAFMGLIWPCSGEIFTVSTSIQHEVITNELAFKLLSNRQKIAALYIPESSEVVSIEDATKSEIIDSNTAGVLNSIVIPDIIPNIDDLDEKIATWVSSCDLQLVSSHESQQNQEISELKNTNLPSSSEAKQLFISYLMINSYMDPKLGQRLLVYDRELAKITTHFTENAEKSHNTMPCLKQSSVSLDKHDCNEAVENHVSEQSVGRHENRTDKEPNTMPNQHFPRQVQEQFISRLHDCFSEETESYKHNDNKTQVDNAEVYNTMNCSEDGVEKQTHYISADRYVAVLPSITKDQSQIQFQTQNHHLITNANIEGQEHLCNQKHMIETGLDGPHTYQEIAMGSDTKETVLDGDFDMLPHMRECSLYKDVECNSFASVSSDINDQVSKIPNDCESQKADLEFSGKTGIFTKGLGNDEEENLLLLKDVEKGKLEQQNAANILKVQLEVGGILDYATGERYDLDTALEKGLVGKDTVLDVLALQFQDGGINDEQTGETLPLKEVVAKGLIPSHVGLQIEEKLGLLDRFYESKTGETITINDAIQQVLVDNDVIEKATIDPERNDLHSVPEGAVFSLLNDSTAQRLLEGQVLSGGILDLEQGKQVSVTLAPKLGLINEQLGEGLLKTEEAITGKEVDDSIKLKQMGLQMELSGMQDPEVQQLLPLTEAIEKAQVDKDTAPSILCKQLEDGGIVQHASGLCLSVGNALKHGLIDQNMVYELSKLENNICKNTTPETFENCSHEVSQKPAESADGDKFSEHAVPYSDLINGSSIDKQSGKRYLDLKTCTEAEYTGQNVQLKKSGVDFESNIIQIGNQEHNESDRCFLSHNNKPSEPNTFKNTSSETEDTSSLCGSLNHTDYLKERVDSIKIETEMFMSHTSDSGSLIRKEKSKEENFMDAPAHSIHCYPKVAESVNTGFCQAEIDSLAERNRESTSDVSNDLVNASPSTQIKYEVQDNRDNLEVNTSMTEAYTDPQVENVTEVEAFIVRNQYLQDDFKIRSDMSNHIQGGAMDQMPDSSEKTILRDSNDSVHSRVVIGDICTERKNMDTNVDLPTQLTDTVGKLAVQSDISSITDSSASESVQTSDVCSKLRSSLQELVKITVEDTNAKVLQKAESQVVEDIIKMIINIQECTTEENAVSRDEEKGPQLSDIDNKSPDVFTDLLKQEFLHSKADEQLGAKKDLALKEKMHETNPAAAAELFQSQLQQVQLAASLSDDPAMFKELAGKLSDILGGNLECERNQTPGSVRGDRSKQVAAAVNETLNNDEPEFCNLTETIKALSKQEKVEQIPADLCEDKQSPQNKTETKGEPKSNGATQHYLKCIGKLQDHSDVLELLKTKLDSLEPLGYNLDTLTIQLEESEDLDKALSITKKQLDATAFDVQYFISEHAQDLSPTQSKLLLKSLNAAQKSFKELMEVVLTQQDTLTLHLEIKQDLSNQKNVAEKQKEYTEKLQKLCHHLTQTENRLIGHQQTTISGDSLGDLQQFQTEHQALQRDVQAGDSALTEVVRCTKKFLEENRGKLQPEQIAMIENKLEEANSKSKLINQRAEESRKDLDKAMTTAIKQETEKVAAVEQLEESKNKIEGLLGWLSNVGKEKDMEGNVEQQMAKQNGNLPLESTDTLMIVEEDEANGNLQQVQTGTVVDGKGKATEELDLNKQYEKVKAHHQEILSQQPDFIIATQSAQALLEKQGHMLSPEEKEKLQRNIQELKDCYETTLTKTEHKMKQIQSVQEELQKFKTDCSEFENWLQQSEGEITDLKTGAPDLSVLNGKLQRQRSFSEDVISHKGDLRFITISGQRVLDAAKSCSKVDTSKDSELDVDTSLVCTVVQDKLDSAANRYKTLHSQALQGQMSGRQGAVEKLRKTADALTATEGDLLANQDTIQETVLEQDISIRHSSITAMKEKVKKFIETADPFTASSLQAKMDTLSKCFTDSCKKHKEKVTKLEELKDKVELFEKTAQKVQQFVAKRSQALSETDGPGKNVNELSQLIQALLEEWLSKASILQEINNKGSALCNLISVLTSPVKTKKTVKSELTVVQQNMSYVNHGYENLGVHLKENVGELDGMLVKLREVQDEANSLMQWFDDINKTTASWDAVPTEAESMKTQMEQQKRKVFNEYSKVIRLFLIKVSCSLLQTFEAELKQKQDKLQQLKEKLLDLLEKHPDTPEAAKWKQMLNQIDSTWKDINSSMDERKQKLEESSKNLTQFQTAEAQLKQWLAEKELMMSVLGPLSIDPNMLNAQKQQVQILQNEFDTRKSQYHQLKESAQGILERPGDLPPSCKVLKDQLAAVAEKWENLTGRLSDRSEQIDQAIVKTNEFQNLLKKISENVDVLNSKLNSQSSLSTQPDTVKQQLETANEICTKLGEQKKNVEEAEVLCKELSALVCEEYLKTDLSRQLESVKKPFKDLEERTGNRIQQLNSAFASSQQFHQMSKDFHGWLDGKRQEHSMSPLISAELETLQQTIKGHAEFQKSLDEQNAAYEKIIKDGETLLQKTQGAEKSALQSQLALLKANWDELKKQSSERQDKLQGCLQRAQKYKEHVEKLRPWIEECENKVAKVKICIDPAEVERSISEVKTLQKDLDKHRGMVELLNTAADSLFEVSQADEDLIRDEKASFNQKVDNMTEQLQNKKDSLEEIAQRLKEFNESHKEAKEQLDGAKQQLEAHESLGAQAYSNKHLTNMKAQQKTLETLKTQVDYLKNLAQGLVVDAPDAAGVSDLLLQTDSLNQEYNSVNQQVEEKCSFLETKLQGIGQFQNNIREMFSQFADFDDELDSMQPVARDLDTLHSQKDDMKSFVNKVQELMVNTVNANKNCKKMLETEGSPDLLGLKRDLEALNKQCSKLMDRAKGREELVETTLTRVDELYKKIKELSEKLQLAKEHEESQGPVGMETEIINQQLEVFKAQQKTLETLKTQVDYLKNLAQGLVVDAPDAAGVSDLLLQTDSLNQEYNSVNQQVEEKCSFLETKLQGIGQFQNNIREMFSQFADFDDELDSMQPVARDLDTLQSQKDDMKSFVNKVQELMVNTVNANKNCKKMLETEGSPDLLGLKRDLEALNKQCSKLMDRAKGREELVETTLIRVDELYKKIKELSEKLQVAKEHEESQGPVGMETEIINQQLDVFKMGKPLSRPDCLRRNPTCVGKGEEEDFNIEDCYVPQRSIYDTVRLNEQIDSGSKGSLTSRHFTDRTLPYSHRTLDSSTLCSNAVLASSSVFELRGRETNKLDEKMIFDALKLNNDIIRASGTVLPKTKSHTEKKESRRSWRMFVPANFAEFANRSEGSFVDGTVVSDLSRRGKHKRTSNSLTSEEDSGLCSPTVERELRHNTRERGDTGGRSLSSTEGIHVSEDHKTGFTAMSVNKDHLFTPELVPTGLYYSEMTETEIPEEFHTYAKDPFGIELEGDHHDGLESFCRIPAELQNGINHYDIKTQFYPNYNELPTAELLQEPLSPEIESYWPTVVEMQLDSEENQAFDNGVHCKLENSATTADVKGLPFCIEDEHFTHNGVYPLNGPVMDEGSGSRVETKATCLETDKSSSFTYEVPNKQCIDAGQGTPGQGCLLKGQQSK